MNSTNAKLTRPRSTDRPRLLTRGRLSAGQRLRMPELGELPYALRDSYASRRSAASGTPCASTALMTSFARQKLDGTSRPEVSASMVTLLASSGLLPAMSARDRSKRAVAARRGRGPPVRCLDERRAVTWGDGLRSLAQLEGASVIAIGDRLPCLCFQAPCRQLGVFAVLGQLRRSTEPGGGSGALRQVDRACRCEEREPAARYDETAVFYECLSGVE
jgi:hypothetical protein